VNLRLQMLSGLLDGFYEDELHGEEEEDYGNGYEEHDQAHCSFLVEFDSFDAAF